MKHFDDLPELLERALPYLQFTRTKDLVLQYLLGEIHDAVPWLPRTVGIGRKENLECCVHNTIATVIRYKIHKYPYLIVQYHHLRNALQTLVQVYEEADTKIQVQL